MLINKLISYNLKHTYSSKGLVIVKNDCFNNCSKALEYNNSMMYAVGFVIIKNSSIITYHAWIEDKENIHELTLPQNSNYEYHRVLLLNKALLDKYNNEGYTPGRLIDHKHFILDYCRTQRKLVKAGYNKVYGGIMSPCKLELIKLFSAMWGKMCRIIKNWA